MDREQLADFLRTRRSALQPEDVGLPRGPRRRTHGLRREEVAALCGMSADYYTRIEQQRGPLPSEPMLAALARGMRLSVDERDHLFRIAGHNTPARGRGGDHVSPGTMRILDRLTDTPAQVISDVGETLVQTRLAIALLGDETRYTGLDRSFVHRWFTDPLARRIYPSEDHPRHGRIFTSELRAAYSSQGPASRAGEIVSSLLARSEEFAALWADHEISIRGRDAPKRIAHPDLGVVEVHCQILRDPDHAQSLLVYTATPGTGSHDKLQLLPVLGERQPHL
ncbi:helix-turn-helix transcriptional regulator [Streptomyces sp. TS71-3]|uniref:helix-turn-helix transcriptional regulator n=1 Tax=Streptomyces sp. TS71-3 TaxID=2733862 RepID=UPI001B06C2FB|nr:helix-turn-helix transcriptional regulator [Streptomyces sp. TS71-3]GHJ39113.1 transcriptional regulator [Streptomyces sp. TS71-3]